MNKSGKKLLVTGLIISLLIASLPAFFVEAQVIAEPDPHFRVDSASTTPPGAEKEDGTKINIINRSDKDYFVPNKTLAEFDSFRNNAPRYVSVAECGDGVCSSNQKKCFNSPKVIVTYLQFSQQVQSVDLQARNRAALFRCRNRINHHNLLFDATKKVVSKFYRIPLE